MKDFYKLAKPLGVDIVFISSDQDQKSFDVYYKKMPWYALPLMSNGIKTKLAKAFHIRGIPSVIVLDTKTGNYITDNGRNDILQLQEVDIEQVKNVMTSWMDIEAVPHNQAKFTEGAGWIQQIFGILKKNPTLFIIIIYFYSWISDKISGKK